MNSRERVIRTLQHKSVDRLPREPWMLPGISMFRAEEKAAFDRATTVESVKKARPMLQAATPTHGAAPLR